MRALITGNGNMGRAIASALISRGDDVAASVGRGTLPPTASELGPVDVSFEFSHSTTLLAHVQLALDAGCRALVIGTTGWSLDDELGSDLVARLEAAHAAAVVAPTFSLGAVLFGDIAEYAARLMGGFTDYDPFIFEEHRRDKADRPSGTALAVADRLLPHLRSKRQARLASGPDAPDPDVLEVVALRAGSHPGMHIVGFDGPGESLEIRIAARDRSAYVGGALLAADTLLDDPKRAGVIRFSDLVRERAGQGAS